MNERIRELAKQATKQYSPTYYTQEWIQGFAELIVKECAQYMYENYPHSRYEVDYMRKHMGDINWNKPFGVEE